MSQISEFFARKISLKVCRPYNSKDKIDNVIASIRTKEWFIYYLRVLIGEKRGGLPSHSGMSTQTFEIMDKKLETKIQELQDEREALRSDYTNAEPLIVILKKDIEALEERQKYLKITKKINRVRVCRFDTMKERLAALERELKRDNFNVAELLELFKESKEMEAEQKAEAAMRTEADLEI